MVARLTSRSPWRSPTVLRCWTACWCWILAVLTSQPFAASPAVRGLYEAARDGDRSMVARLLATGVDPDVRIPGNGHCALTVAANQGYDRIVALLVAKGADPRCGPPAGPPLVLAARGGHLGVVEVLLGAGVGTLPADDETLQKALAAAAADGHPKTSGRLVAAGAAVDGALEDGITPLHRAARAGRSLTVSALLAAGAAIDRADSQGRTALHWASWQGHEAVVRVLVARGASTEITDAAGDRPFLDASGVEEAIARMVEARRRQDAPRACPIQLLSANVFQGEITVWGVPRKPEPGSEVWVLPGSAEPIAARVRSAENEPCAGMWFNAMLTPVEGPFPDLAYDGLAVLGTSPVPRRVAAPPRSGLPWGMAPATVEASVDLDGDERPELILRSHCCGVPWLPESGSESGGFGCDYTCWDSWARDENGWHLCASGGPC